MHYRFSVYFRIYMDLNGPIIYYYILFLPLWMIVKKIKLITEINLWYIIVEYYGVKLHPYFETTVYIYL